jgi:hypothetical protein
MIYDRGTPNDGQWHCPFSREWVQRMKRAAKCCEPLTAEQIEAAYMRIDSGMYFELPPGDFLSEPQDSRGLPLSFCQREEEQFAKRKISCIDIYDYCTIPELVITDGYDDWPLVRRGQVMTA